MNASHAKHDFSHTILNTAVIVAALGYFVDIYDLVLFSIVRVPSLQDLGLRGQQLLDDGLFLINMQMLGMLVGGVFWGILGDKKGRLSILFGSIVTYSLANIANGFVSSIDVYAVLRFIAGVGLAGELGAGITLVVEIMPKEIRGYGTMIVASVGVSGAILAYFIAELFDWRVAYFIGGGLGLALLVLRIGVYESGMFSTIKESAVKRGDFFSLFTSRERFSRYIRCVLVGVPIWLVVGILVTFSPEFAAAMGIQDTVSGGRAIMFCYVGLALGDFLTGYLSQVLKSRKKVLLAFLIFDSLCIALYFLSSVLFSMPSAQTVYNIALLLGLSSGYWAIFVTVAAEQFGTNLRATVATTAPNFVRGSLVPMTWLFRAFVPSFGLIGAGIVTSIVALSIAYLCLWGLEETFGRELNYTEMI
ncbi:MAG: MFS transporter [Bacteroidota bacterium]|nr:MFS transporter [Candidatus Kapabacteria bacterium]MDW8220425.1 MFS transporter [Bacteroidota bacterium]